MTCTVHVAWDERLTDYHFGPGHPLAPVRVELTMQLAHEFGLWARPGVTVAPPPPASSAELELVHHPRYIEAVRTASRWADDLGAHGLDPAQQRYARTFGLATADNPVFPGMHQASALLAGATLAAAPAGAGSRPYRMRSFRCSARPLDPAAFAQVDTVYRDTYARARGHAGALRHASGGDCAGAVLQQLTIDAASADEVLTRLRAAQAGLFAAGLLLDLRPVRHPPWELRAGCLRPRLDHATVTRLRGLADPVVAAAVTLSRSKRADLVRKPGRTDYPAEIKRWRAFADQAEQMAKRWEQPPQPQTPPGPGQDRD